MKPHEFFNDLNYSLANEDTHIEYDLLEEKYRDSVFCIGGSGARVLPLLSLNPKNLTIVDMSQEQLYLVELRIEAAKALSYEEYLYFMGYRGGIQGESSINRSQILSKIQLSEATRKYWTTHQKAWEPSGFIYLGRWERHFSKLSLIFREYLGFDFSNIFKKERLDEQIAAFQKDWPKKRLGAFLRVVASEYVFNKFIYKGHFSGSSNHKTETLAPWKFLLNNFERIFQSQLVRKNYFFQWLFLGEIRYEEGLPLEAHRIIIEKIKSTKTNVSYLNDNLLSVIQKEEFSFYSLSDTISYLNTQDANEILLRLPDGKYKEKRVVIRSFMRAPTQINNGDFIQETELEKTAFVQEGTSVYQFHIFKRGDSCKIG